MWKEVEGYEGIYEISTDGRLRNIKTGTFLNPFDNGGYDRYVLSKNGFSEKVLAHRIVAKAFIPCDDYSLTVNHKDGNKRNNNVSNLEWMTVGDNVRHSLTEERREKLRNTMSEIGKKYGKVNAKKRRKPVVQLSLDGKYIRQYESAREASKETGISYKLISRVCRGERKQTGGYIWEFAEGQSTIRKE